VGSIRTTSAPLVVDIYKSPGVLPERSDLFRAFHLTSLEDVRVVILGQDPYPRPRQAHGLAFSVPDGEGNPPVAQGHLHEPRERPCDPVQPARQRRA